MTIDNKQSAIGNTFAGCHAELVEASQTKRCHCGLDPQSHNKKRPTCKVIAGQARNDNQGVRLASPSSASLRLLR
jgi:hypothetical protein